MEEVWQRAREVTDAPQKFVERLVKAVGHAILAEVPAGKFEELQAKIKKFEDEKRKRIAEEEEAARAAATQS